MSHNYSEIKNDLSVRNVCVNWCAICNIDVLMYLCSFFGYIVD